MISWVVLERDGVAVVVVVVVAVAVDDMIGLMGCWVCEIGCWDACLPKTLAMEMLVEIGLLRIFWSTSFCVSSSLALSSGLSRLWVVSSGSSKLCTSVTGGPTKFSPPVNCNWCQTPLYRQTLLDFLFVIPSSLSQNR